MSTLDADRPNRLPWPPILYLATLAAAFVLEREIPLGMLEAGGLWRVIGAVVAAVGIMISIAGFLRFKTEKTPVDPTARAVTLVTSGIYRYTRNPMYLGFCIFYFGLGIALSWPWLSILAPIMAYGLQKLAIKREEKHLEARFGETWRAYRSKVARWL